jgi:hypothetical protein
MGMREVPERAEMRMDESENESRRIIGSENYEDDGRMRDAEWRRE